MRKYDPIIYRERADLDAAENGEPMYEDEYGYLVRATSPHRVDRELTYPAIVFDVPTAA